MRLPFRSPQAVPCHPPTLPPFLGPGMNRSLEDGGIPLLISYPLLPFFQVTVHPAPTLVLSSLSSGPRSLPAAWDGDGGLGGGAPFDPD